MASIASVRSSARFLSIVAGILGVLGVIGGIVLFFAGVVEQCPPGDSFCYDYEKSNNLPLAAAGAVSVLFWLWLLALSSAISSRLVLAADMAERG